MSDLIQDAHTRLHHPLDFAHTPTVAANGWRVYVICGWQGCQARRVLDQAVWQTELRRRQRAATPDGCHGDATPGATKSTPPPQEGA